MADPLKSQGAVPRAIRRAAAHDPGLTSDIRMPRAMTLDAIGS